MLSKVQQGAMEQAQAGKDWEKRTCQGICLGQVGGEHVTGLPLGKEEEGAQPAYDRYRKNRSRP